ncbi:hybrid sensor histidine kinase/response regulator [Marinomonas arenicola]|uniref:histidine kinase n=1 Tax=Marinomonas arenicola TaxID=569601 RepID=A0ABU9G5W9_9GAMM
MNNILKPRFIAILILPFVLAVSIVLVYLDFERRESFSNSHVASEVNRVYSNADSVLNKFYWDSVDTTIHVTFQGVQQDIFKIKDSTKGAYSDLDRIFRNSFLMNKSVTQVRWIDKNGLERYRMNRTLEKGKKDEISVVNKDQLQDKSGRYYFTEAKKLSSGYIYLSKLDLNIENNVIVTPYQPTIRLATPIKDADNRFQGIIVINFNLNDLFQQLNQLSSPGIDVDLFNEQGSLRYSNSLSDSSFLDILSNGILNGNKQTLEGFYQKRDEFEAIKSGVDNLPYHALGGVDYAPQVRAEENIYLLVSTKQTYLDRLFKDNLLESSIIGLIALISGILLLTLIHRSDKKVIRLNSELNKQLKISENSRAFKSQFLANMSHEIRTPMTAISGLLELLLKEDLDEKILKRLKIIKDSSDGLRRIINDILDLSKIESGKSVLSKSEFRPSLTIERSISTFNGSANLNGSELLLDMEPSLFFYYCLGDEYRIEQVINNLLSNAIKFSAGKPITLAVNYTTNSNKTLTLSCAVIDQGVGMSDSLVATLGEKFTQADNTVSKENGGTGLGLSISKELLRSMGSDLEIKSELGKGSEFGFTLELDVVKEESIVDREKIDIYALNVWIINKMNKSSDFINKLFRHWGCNATAISTHDELENLIQSLSTNDNPLDFIIFDIENPVSLDDVQTVIDRFSAQQLGLTKLVLMSSNEQNARTYKDTAIEVHFIKKPVTVSNFLELLQNLELVPNIQLVEDDSSNLVKTLEAKIIDRVARVGAPKILLVEDNLTNQSIISEIFKSVNINVVLANNGQEAVDSVHNHHFDIVFMDVQMPVMDGLEATKIIRHSFTLDELPIIALSAGVTEQEFHTSKEVGMNSHVPKPIDMNKLMQSIIDYWPEQIVTDKEKSVDSAPIAQKSKISLDELNQMDRFDLSNTIFKWLGSDAYDTVLDSFLDDYADLNVSSDTLTHAEKTAFVHKLKGVSGNIGAMSLFASCAEFEVQLNEKDISITPLLTEFMEDIETLKRTKK